MVDTTPFKICIQRAETRQEWDAMQDDYIARSLEACRRIEKLEAALREIAEANSVQAGTDKDMYRRWRYVATNAIDIPKMLRAEALIADEDWTGIYQISPNLAFAAADRIEKLTAALREIAYTEPEDKYWPGRIARKALEEKDD